MDNLIPPQTGTITEAQFTEFATTGKIDGIIPTSQYLFDDGSGATATDSIGSNDLTLFNTPTWEQKAWADQASTMTFDTTQIVLTADQERFQSYNSTSERSISVTSAQSKTYVFQKEFNTQFRVSEEHEGVIFAPMPDATFTSTITLANGTEYEATLVNDDSQDDFSVTARVWHQNGTQTWGNVIWRDLVVRASGQTCAITSYGTCDVAVFSKHVGYEGERHFRLGANGLTAEIANVTFDSAAATIEFSATATGTQDAKVEFLTNIYDTVSEVQIDGDSTAATWSVAKTGTNIGILTINDIDFSEKTIKVFFSATVPGGSGPGGGGGGGGGGVYNPPIVIPPSGPRTSGALTIDIPSVSARPGGDAVSFDISVQWEGSGIVHITAVTFSKNAEWFTLQKPLPIQATMEIAPGEPPANEVLTTIPMTVQVPEGVGGVTEAVDITVTATDGVSTSSVRDDLRITYSTSAIFGYYLGAVVLGGIGLIAIVGALRRRKK